MKTVTNEEALAYHRRTGCPIARAGEILSQLEPLLRERIMETIKKPKRSLALHDPIEDDPSISVLVSAAATEAEDLARQSGRTGRGVCHLIWREQARILAERHNIIWQSPAQMNPGIMYD
jgi:hypothetical protein